MPARSLTFIVGFLVLFGCRREATVAPSMEELRSEVAPVQESWNVRYFVHETPIDTEASIPRVEIRAATMSTYEAVDSTYTLMKGDSLQTRVTAYFYDEAGDTSAVLQADRLLLFEKQHRFEARGDVDVLTPENKRLTSEHLVWYEDNRTLETPGFVRIETPSERVQGYNLVADEDLETYTLKRMTGQVTVEEED